MTKRISRMLAMLLIAVSLFSLCAIGADAASTATEGSKTWKGKSTGFSSTDIYVKTGSSATSRKVDVRGTYGSLGDDVLSVLVWGSYEFTIYKWSGKAWVQEQNYDFYNKGSGTITLKQKNTIYKIHIYAWRSQTVYNAYWNNNAKLSNGLQSFRAQFKYYGQITSGAKWSDVPQLTLTPRKGCTMYKSCPV